MNNHEIAKLIGGHCVGEDKEKPATELSLCIREGKEPELFAGTVGSWQDEKDHKHIRVELTPELITGLQLTFQTLPNYETESGADRRIQAAKFIKEWIKQ